MMSLMPVQSVILPSLFKILIEMDLLDILDPNKKVKRFNLEPKEVKNVLNESPTASTEISLLNTIGTEYAKKYVEKDNEKSLQTVILNCENDMDNFDKTSIGTALIEVDDQELTRIYKKFNFEYYPDNKLTINESKDIIMSTIEAHSVTIIKGVTGSGKSTRVWYYK